MGSGTEMILISHRGNVNGPNKDFENHPLYIDLAIEQGYDVEIDLWMKNGNLYLGHDEPDIEIDSHYLSERKNELWIHCKNYLALSYCIDNNLHCFYHDRDDYTITSHGFVWAYPGQPLASKRCVMVKPELFGYPPVDGYFAVCSDNVERVGEYA
jgi:hypothetical protein